MYWHRWPGLAVTSASLVITDPACLSGRIKLVVVTGPVNIHICTSIINHQSSISYSVEYNLSLIHHLRLEIYQFEDRRTLMKNNSLLVVFW